MSLKAEYLIDNLTAVRGGLNLRFIFEISELNNLSILVFTILSSLFFAITFSTKILAALINCVISRRNVMRMRAVMMGVVA